MTGYDYGRQCWCEGVEGARCVAGNARRDILGADAVARGMGWTDGQRAQFIDNARRELRDAVREIESPNPDEVRS